MDGAYGAVHIQVPDQESYLMHAKLGSLHNNIAHK